MTKRMSGCPFTNSGFSHCLFNGFLEMWLELGIIGMGLMIAFLVVCVFRTIFRPLPDGALVFILPFFIAMIVNDLAETHLFVYKHYGWIVMLIFVFVTTPGLETIRRSRIPRETVMSSRSSLA